jgi:hypothetical protein
MADYYKHSALNIVAGIDQPHLGLFEPRWPPRFPAGGRQQSLGQGFAVGWLGTEAFSDARGSSIEELPDSWRYISPVHRRAWTQQEIRLARRNLVFQSDESRDGISISAQLYLKCQEQIIWENGRCRSLEFEKDDDCVWYTLVEQYSGQRLAYESDRLPAISALAREHAWKIGDEYVAGLWKSELLRGILWRVDQDEYSDEAHSRYSANNAAPSWSWASARNKIKFCWPTNTTIRAEVIDYLVYLASRDPYGEVTGGHLIIRGSARSFALEDLPKSYDPSVVDIEEEIGVGNGHAIRIRCWLDSPSALEKLDGRHVVGLRITQRLGLVLIADQVVLESFRRVGMMAIAKTDVGNWDLYSETKEIRLV